MCCQVPLAQKVMCETDSKENFCKMETQAFKEKVRASYEQQV